MQLILDAKAIEDLPGMDCDVWGSKSAGEKGNSTFNLVQKHK